MRQSYPIKKRKSGGRRGVIYTGDEMGCEANFNVT